MQKELLCICCRCTFGSDMKTRCEKSGKACEGLVGCRPRCARGRRCHDAMVGRWEVGANNWGAVLRSRQRDFITSHLANHHTSDHQDYVLDPTLKFASCCILDIRSPFPFSTNSKGKHSW
ncbi:hypothetical protein HBH69_001410 [Parastagonospora nodorum]|nr:hypothetical protein HBH42_009480 [Parastagonospora nodorum]KAH5164027.1 hypothetical protein HBH69_001410 [Parastagonospora nodorum]KAH6503274.1 hypothetical protein HBI55_030140 [Parastagonospora nodorum]